MLLRYMVKEGGDVTPEFMVGGTGAAKHLGLIKNNPRVGTSYQQGVRGRMPWHM